MSDLSAHRGPNVAIDVAVLTVDHWGSPGAGLAVATLERTAQPAGTVLPGRFLRENESVTECIHTALREKVGIDAPSVSPLLLRVFDAPGRDPRAWTISLAHVVVLPRRSIPGPVTRVDEVSGLLFDHDVILEEAVTRVRERYELGPDPDGLLDDPFTLAELRSMHEAVLGAEIRRDTFRRRMEPLLFPHLESGVHASRSDGGRPARLWSTKRSPDSLSLSLRSRLPRESDPNRFSPGSTTRSPRRRST